MFTWLKDKFSFKFQSPSIKKGLNMPCKHIANLAKSLKITKKFSYLAKRYKILERELTYLNKNLKHQHNILP